MVTRFLTPEESERRASRLASPLADRQSVTSEARGAATCNMARPEKSIDGSACNEGGTFPLHPLSPPTRMSASVLGIHPVSVPHEHWQVDDPVEVTWADHQR